MIAGKKYRAKCGTIVEGLQTGKGTSYFCRSYYPVYMFCRLLFAIVLVLFESFPYLQIMLVIFIVVIPVLAGREKF